MSRLAAGTGIVAGVLSRSSLAGVGSGGVSAARDAADLVRRRPTAGEKRRRKRSGGGGAGADAEVEEGSGGDSDGSSDDEGGDTAAAAAEDADAPIKVVSPTLPGVDVLVTTPLLLVALLRHTAAAGAAGPGEPPRRVQVVLATLRVLVADEVDKLLEESFLEQVCARGLDG